MLTDEEVERYLNQIFMRQKLIYVENKLILLKQPDNEIKMRSNLVYDDAYNKAISSGLVSVKDLQKIIEERNLFSERDQKELDGLKSQLEAQKILLGKTTMVKANQERIKGTIDRLEGEIAELENKRTSKLAMSAENKASEEKALYICWACTYIETDDGVKKLWPEFKKLLNEPDSDFRNKVFLEFLKFKAGIDTRLIRFIARHSLWRIRYVTSQKVSEDLFGIPTSQYTNDMLNLAYWSNFYQSVYEMMSKDRPPDTIIDDDEALDAYMKAYYEERSREDAAERDKSRFGNRGKLSAFNQEEVIVTRSHELYEDIEYDTPREAQRIKDKAAISKKTKKGGRKR
jgi:hypothetical protein